MGRLRASLRAYAVMEGEDPVAVLSDLELLLRLTEPARTATALFAYCEPAARKVVLAGAGHTPPLILGERRCEYVETTLSAPLGMLACWEAPSVEFSPRRAKRCCSTRTGCCAVPGTRWTAPSPGCTPPPPPYRNRTGTIRRPWPTTSCARCSPTASTGADSTEDVVILAAHFD